MNPAFSSQAIKGMFPIMVDEAKIFVKYLNSLVDNNASDPVDISNVLQQVTLVRKKILQHGPHIILA
jgi:hypothetical protein